MHEGDQILTGAQLDGMDGQALLAACRHTPVFARVSPRHRLRIVQALRGRGETVAISGKHAWDVPAMEAADLGVAADGEAPQAVCEAAGAILFGGGAPALAAAIEETRVTEGNLLRFLRYQLTFGAQLALIMLFGALMGMPPVLLPVQLLAVRLLANGPVAAALGGEPAGSIPRRRERGEDCTVFSDGLMQGVWFRAALTALLSLGTFSVLLTRGAEPLLARAGAVAALVFSHLLSALSCRGERRAARRILPLDNIPLLIAALTSLGLTLAIIYHPGLAGFLQTAPLNAQQFGLAAAAGGAAAARSLFPGTAFYKKEKTGRAVRLVRRGPV
jgi:Ca2+-transporting ATPase